MVQLVGIGSHHCARLAPNSFTGSGRRRFPRADGDRLAPTASQKPLRATTPAKQNGELDPEGDVGVAGAFPRIRDLGELCELVIATTNASAQLEVGFGAWAASVVAPRRRGPRIPGHGVGANPTGRGRALSRRGASGIKSPRVAPQVAVARCAPVRPTAPAAGPGGVNSYPASSSPWRSWELRSVRVKVVRPRLAPRSPSQLRETRCPSSYWPRNFAGLNGVCFCHT